MDLDSYGYIGQMLIAMHGGEIRLKETSEAGAVIQFVLPKN
jgi:K+-sensing histidine kinase KdpD